MFVNTLALRSKLNTKESYNTYLSELHNLVLSSFDHQLYQYEDLVDALDLDRNTSRNPLFDVLFSYFKEEEDSAEELPMSIEAYQSTGLEETSKFDLSLTITDSNESLELIFNYRTSLFDSSTIERFAGYFEKIVEQVLKDQTTSLERLTSYQKKKSKPY